MRCSRWTYLSVTLLLFATIGTNWGAIDKQSEPRFFVILWDGDDAQIVKQGSTSHADFRRLFLESYGMKGERFHPGKSTAIGMLVAHYEHELVSVPIRTWRLKDGTSVFLCQGSDDGRPPEFTIFSHSKENLLSQMEKALGEGQRDKTVRPR